MQLCNVGIQVYTKYVFGRNHYDSLNNIMIYGSVIYYRVVDLPQSI